MAERVNASGICKCRYAIEAVERLKADPVIPNTKCGKDGCSVIFTRNKEGEVDCGKALWSGQPRCGVVLVEIQKLNHLLERDLQSHRSARVKVIEGYRKKLKELAKEADDMGVFKRNKK